MLEYGDKEMPVYENIINPKTGAVKKEIVKKAIYLIAMDKLVEHMMKGDRRTSLMAIDKLLDRIIGKPVQPIENTEVDPEDQYQPTEPVMLKTMEFYQKERKRYGARTT